MSATEAPPTTAAEQFEQRSHGPLDRIQHLLHRYPSISPLVVLVAACIVFSILNSAFISPRNLSIVLQQVAVVGGVAIGQTLIILTAGIDLSVGAIMIFSGLVMAKVSADNGVPGVLALVLGLVIGTAAGFLNGQLITRLRLPPFIVTLGTLSIFSALGLLLSGGQSIGGDQMSSLLTWTGTPVPVGTFRLTTGVLLILALYLVVGFALSQTAWGRHVYAVGDDADAARLAGISVNKVLLSVYTVAGLIIAITSWVQIGRIDTASPNVGSELNLDSITAVVIGGTSLFGGRGLLLGTALGALTVGVFRNGLSLAGVDVLYQQLVIGILVIAAVSVDQWIRRVKA